MEPPFDVQQQLNASGDNLQDLQEELREAELEAQKKRLVDSFYNEVSHTYGLRPKAGSTIASSGSIPTVRHFTGHLQEDLHCCDEGKIPVSGSRHAGPKIRGWWCICSAEINGAH